MKPITLEDRELIKSYLSKDEILSSELTFLTMYIWRKGFHIHYTIIENCVIFQMQDEESPLNFRFPLGDGDKMAAIHTLKECYDDRLLFYGLTEKQASSLSDEFVISPMSAYADYIYKTSDLIRLSGKKYHSKKNHLNAFKKLYDYKYQPMDAGNALQCINAYEGWFENIENDANLIYEKEAITDVLMHFNQLSYSGGVLYADGEICAFTISEQLNSNTAVIHIEKANKEIRGAYAAINQMHLEDRWSNIEFVNREEDIGLEGLRKAKMSYHPCARIPKYKARLKQK